MNLGIKQGMMVAVTAGVLGMSAMTQAAIITQWTFEGDVTTPSTGSGTATLIGGTTATFATGNGGGRGWNTTTYPAQSTASGTAGVEFAVSTAGYLDIKISFDHRASGTASRWAQVLYTTDGTVWNVLGDNGGGLSPHDTFYPFNFTLPAAANDKTAFAFRIVSIFSPQPFDQNATLPDFAANTAYMRANAQASYTAGGGVGTGDYGTTGTWRFDNVTVTGNPIPEPASLALLALGTGVMMLRRRQA